MVERTSPADIKMRDLYVRVDDQPERTVRYGQAIEVPLAEGDHTLVVTNRLQHKRETFHIGDGERVEYEAANVPMRGPLSVLAVFSGTVMYRPVLKRRKRQA